MCSGERPIGAAKGKQPDTEALCYPPPSLCGGWGAGWVICAPPHLTLQPPGGGGGG